MKKILFLVISISFITACSVQKSQKTNSSLGNTRTVPVKRLDANAYQLSEQSQDSTYGYEETNPSKVGGMNENSGPKNEQRFLNGLAGPAGESIGYYRAGSCCSFKTPNALFGDSGLLDAYKVYWKGGTDTLTLYINMYDEGDLKIPVKLTARK